MLQQLDLFGNPIQEDSASQPEQKKSAPSRRAELLRAAVEKLQGEGVKDEEMGNRNQELGEEEIGSGLQVVGSGMQDAGSGMQLAGGIEEELGNRNQELGEEELGIEEQVLEEEDTIEFEIPAIRKVSVKDDMRPTPQKGKRGRKSLKELKDEVQYVQIPEDEKLFKRQYYSIGEVADMFNVNTSLIRFWENSFDIIKPRKNRKGDRHFRPEDVKNLHLIYHLLREKKYTIEGAKDYMKSQLAQAKQQHDVLQRLQKIKQFLVELKSQL